MYKCYTLQNSHLPVRIDKIVCTRAHVTPYNRIKKTQDDNNMQRSSQ